MSDFAYQVPASAPQWVKNILKGSPSRGTIQTLIALSVLAAVVGVYCARWNPATLAAVFFLYYAVIAGAALHWADRNGVFRKKEPIQPPVPTRGNGT